MRWTIRRKLYALVGVIAVLLSVLGAITYERFKKTADIEDQLNRAHHVQTLASDMADSLLQARRREKDFLLRDGDSKYREQVAKHGAQFLSTSAELRALLKKGTEVAGAQFREQSLAELDDAMKQYLSVFENSATTFHERGLAETGAQGRMRKSAHALESLVDEHDDLEAKVWLLQARRNEKDYMLRDNIKYQEQAHAALEKLQTRLAVITKDAEARRRISELTRDYADNFDLVVETTKRLDKHAVELHDTHARIEPKLVELEVATGRYAEELSGEVQSVRNQALLTLFIAFGLVLAMAAAATTWISRQIASAVAVLADATRRVAVGDLTTAVKVDSKDELADLGESFNQMMGGLRDLSAKITETANLLNSIATELSATVAEQSAAVRQQAAAVTETMSTMEEMTRSASNVADTAQNVSTGAATSVETSTRGESALKQSVDGMLSIREQVQNIATTILELSEKTQQIGSIISTVDDFAEQSSLLALNASIEAARAGEQGKAFSVVAAEIKKLAEQSQQATGKVRGILNQIQRATHAAVMVTEEGSKRVDRGVSLTESAGSIVMELVETIKHSARSAKQIASAAQQQASGIEQVSTAMGGIDQSSRQNVAAIKQTETASQTLADITQQLQKVSSRYRVA